MSGQVVGLADASSDLGERDALPDGTIRKIMGGNPSRLV